MDVKPCRRVFLKTSLMGTAGVLAATVALPEAQAQAQVSSWPATGYLQINPHIDNCRVVYVTDKAFIKRIGWTNFTDVNTNAIDFARVQAAMDRMAMCLAKQCTPGEAWATIFRRPTAKTWAEVKVAMKVNACGSVDSLSPNVGSVGKLCLVLMGLGVLPANITIYDAGAASGANAVLKYSPFQTSGVIPAGVIIENRGTTCPITVDTHVGPWTTNTVTTVRDADILIDCAVAKGHDRLNQFSGVTMSVKNHVGTVNFAHRDDNETIGDLAAYHKHPYLLGNPTADVPAKQQLCFVDSLWAGKPGDWSGGVLPGSELYTLTMGTLAGPVDYYTTKKVRTLVYNDFNVALVNTFVTAFGYSDAEQVALDALGSPDDDPQGRGFVNAGSTANCPGYDGGTILDASNGGGNADSSASGGSNGGGVTGVEGGGATSGEAGGTQPEGGAGAGKYEANPGCGCEVGSNTGITKALPVAFALGGAILALGRRAERVRRDEAHETHGKHGDDKKGTP